MHIYVYKELKVIKMNQAEILEIMKKLLKILTVDKITQRTEYQNLRQVNVVEHSLNNMKKKIF